MFLICGQMRTRRRTRGGKESGRGLNSFNAWRFQLAWLGWLIGLGIQPIGSIAMVGLFDSGLLRRNFFSGSRSNYGKRGTAATLEHGPWAQCSFISGQLDGFVLAELLGFRPPQKKQAKMKTFHLMVGSFSFTLELPITFHLTTLHVNH